MFTLHIPKRCGILESVIKTYAQAISEGNGGRYDARESYVDRGGGSWVCPCSDAYSSFSHMAFFGPRAAMVGHERCGGVERAGAVIMVRGSLKGNPAFVLSKNIHYTKYRCKNM